MGEQAADLPPGVKRGERELAEFLDSAAVAVHWVGPDGTLLWASRAELALLGYTPEEYIGHSIAEFHADVDLIPDILERLRRGEALRDYEARLRCKDGSLKHVLLSCNVLWEDGHVVLAKCLTRDITELKRAEEALRESEERFEAENARLLATAEEAGRAKDEFLATLSHELRTPLNAIAGWAYLLRSGTLDAVTAARALEIIDRNARVQGRLVADLLDTSQIVSGKLRLNMRAVDLPAVVEAAVGTARAAAEAKGVRLEAALDPAVVPVLGDPERLQQVVWNLLSNGIKFTPRGGRVRLGLRRGESHVEIKVEDTGLGIEAAFLPHLFERFRQADSSTTRGFGGLGLGLAMVRHLIELHGGTVAASSGGPGQGAAFTVKLPLLITAAWEGAASEHRAAGDEADLEPTPSLAGVKVLIVKDDPDIRDFIATVLEERGALTAMAESAAEGFESLPRFGPDVLLSDIDLPHEDGYSFMRRVRALPAAHGGRVPAAAITAYARVTDRIRALLAGFQAHLAQPVQPVELVTVVASLAGRTPLG